MPSGALLNLPGYQICFLLFPGNISLAPQHCEFGWFPGILLGVRNVLLDSHENDHFL